MFGVHSGIPNAYNRQYICCNSTYISVDFNIYIYTKDYSLKIKTINFIKIFVIYDGVYICIYTYIIIIIIFINCNWVVTRWQYTFTHKNNIEQHN